MRNLTIAVDATGDLARMGCARFPVAAALYEEALTEAIHEVAHQVGQSVELIYCAAQSREGRQCDDQLDSGDATAVTARWIADQARLRLQWQDDQITLSASEAELVLAHAGIPAAACASNTAGHAVMTLRHLDQILTFQRQESPPHHPLYQ